MPAMVMVATNLWDTDEAIDLGRRLKDDDAWRYLVRLWAWGIKAERVDGIIPLPPHRIAAECGYHGNPDALLKALTSTETLDGKPSPWLEDLGDGRYYMRGWESIYSRYFNERKRLQEKAKREKDARAERRRAAMEPSHAADTPRQDTGNAAAQPTDTPHERRGHAVYTSTSTSTSTSSDPGSDQDHGSEVGGYSGGVGGASQVDDYPVVGDASDQPTNQPVALEKIQAAGKVLGWPDWMRLPGGRCQRVIDLMPIAEPEHYEALEATKQEVRDDPWGYYAGCIRKCRVKASQVTTGERRRAPTNDELLAEATRRAGR